MGSEVGIMASFNITIISIIVKKIFIKAVLIIKMCRFVGGGHGGFAAFFNAGVHTVMPSYFASSSS